MAENTQNKRPYVAAFGAFLLLILLGVIFLIPRFRHNRELKETAAQANGPIPVRVATVSYGAPTSTIDLQGTVQAFQQTPIFARTNGYVSRRFVDIGDHVKQGQLLAIIEDPTTEQSLRNAEAVVTQMKAQLALQQANAKLSTVNNARWNSLVKAGVVSQLDADTHAAEAGANDAAVAAAQANIIAAEANVKSLKEQLGFSRVTAPFSGVILSRSIDVGTLISSGSANSVTQMFSIGESNKVRVFTSVPQSFAPAIQQAHSAKVTFRELPGQEFVGNIARSANSIDPASRTMLTEVDLDNSKGSILPGMYATVEFTAPNVTRPVLLPQNALIVRTAGPQAFVVDANNTVHLRRLALGRDFGDQIEVVSGLQAGDHVILNPSDSITDGAAVEPQSGDEKATKSANK